MNPATTWRLAGRPRQWQESALESWESSGRRGIASVVTGGGKTFFAFACMNLVRTRFPEVRFVIIVPTIALADQWIVGLTEDLGVSASDIAVWGGGDRPRNSKLVNVAVINSARRIAPMIAAEYSTFLIVDECHRSASPRNAEALAGQHFATLGLSATPRRDWDDLFEEVVEPALGRIVYEYGYNEARRDGVISPFNLVNVQVELSDSERASYDRYSKLIAAASRREEAGGGNERLERLLRQRARVSARAKSRLPMAIRLVEQHRLERAIIFHEDIDAANIMCQALLSRAHRAAVYHSGLGAGFRRDNLRMFRSGQIDILVTCRALDEGVNVPDARVAVIAASTASTRQRIQRLGRVLRPAENKSSATVYTVYATKAEEARLRIEAENLEGAESVRWLAEAD